MLSCDPPDTSFFGVTDPGSVRISLDRRLFGLALAGRGIAALEDNAGLRDGLNIHRGMITNRAVAESLGLQFTAVNKAMAA